MHVRQLISLSVWHGADPDVAAEDLNALHDTAPCSNIFPKLRYIAVENIRAVYSENISRRRHPSDGFEKKIFVPKWTAPILYEFTM